MKRRRNQVDAQLRGADPFPASRTDGWTETPEGKATAERVRTEMTRSAAVDRSPKVKRRRGPLLLAAALAALLAIGASFAVLHRHPATSTVVGCYRELSQGARTHGLAVPRGLTPAEACAQQWQSWFGDPAPARLAECVIEGGGIGVFPYPASMEAREACISIGAAIPDGTDGTGG